jgi:hypothetical protein
MFAENTPVHIPHKLTVHLLLLFGLIPSLHMMLYVAHRERILTSLVHSTTPPANTSKFPDLENFPVARKCEFHLPQAN